MMKSKLFYSLALVLCLLMTACVCHADDENLILVEFDFEAGSEFGGVLTVSFADGSTEETGGYGFGWEGEAGSVSTVGDVLSMLEIASIEPALEGDEFEGWMVYEVVSVEDEDGFETSTYVKAEDALYSTEELFALPVPDFYAVYTAKWASVSEEEYFSAIEEETITLPSITMLSGDGVMLMHSKEEDYECTMHIVTVEEGQTFGEALALEDLLSVTLDGKEFTGWTVYDVHAMESTDAPVEQEGVMCIELFEGWYVVLKEYNVCAELVTTQELAEMVCSVNDHVVIANFQ